MNSLQVISLNESELICLHSIIWFEVYLFIVGTQLNSFKYSTWLNSSIWTIDGTQTGTTTLGQSGLGSNGYEGVIHTPQSSRTGVSPSLTVYCHIQDIRQRWVVMQLMYSTAPANWTAINQCIFFYCILKWKVNFFLNLVKYSLK